MKATQCFRTVSSVISLILFLVITGCAGEGPRAKGARYDIGFEVNQEGDLLIAVEETYANANGTVDLYLFAAKGPVRRPGRDHLFSFGQAISAEYSENRLSIVTPEGEQHIFTVGASRDSENGSSRHFEGRAMARYEAFSEGTVKQGLRDALKLGLRLDFPVASSCESGGPGAGGCRTGGQYDGRIGKGCEVVCAEPSYSCCMSSIRCGCVNPGVPTATAG